MTPPRFELTGPAERDFEEIFFEVKERHGLVVAERVYGNLLRTFDLLAGMPDMGASSSRAMAALVSLLANRHRVHRLSE